MRTVNFRHLSGGLIFFLACGFSVVASAQTKTIRVVTYNIEDDINGATVPLPGLIAASGGSVTNGGVLEGIGEEIINGDPAQPIDVLALEETTSNTTTVQPIVNGLNAFYGSRNIPAGYAMSSYQATDTGGSNAGNGPNAMVYNTNTLQLIASVGVGTPTGSGNGEYRQEVRYEFAPAGVTPTTNNEFYVYVGHYKSGTTSSDVTDRNGEAQIVRADVATLPSGARVLFTGDFNTGAASEAMYQTLVAPGVNRAFDVLNPTGSPSSNFDGAGDVAELTESATDLRYRDDYQMMTSNVLYGVSGGLAYVPGTYHAFGNNGTSPYQGSVNSGSDTALNSDLNTNGIGISASTLYSYLTTASDHLPAVADYTITAAAPYSPQSIKTVFIILEENQNWASISGNAACPYINNGLLPKSSYTLQYYNPPGNHPSLPNYLWLEAGTNFGILADGDALTYHESTTNHLVTLLKNAGISWTSFQEGITGTTCPLTDSGQYVAKHNPMVHFDDVTNTNNTGSTYCISNVRPFTELAGDLQSNVVTRYNWITPNLCDDMHGNTGCLTGNALLTAGDTWLSNTVAEIMGSQAYSNNGAIFVTWDEGEGGDGPIGMIVVSPLAKGGGYSNSIHYTHSSTLLTMQEIFNVWPALGDATNATDLSDLFVFGPQLAVNPASGLTASGVIGGPFTPSSMTNTLSNTGGVAAVWFATNTLNWLTILPTNGTLAAGASTNIIVSINANANALTGGTYSDNVVFAMSNGSGKFSQPVNLTVNNPSAQLSVSPSLVYAPFGQPGGPFSPASQTYIVTNAGGATMNWTANNSTTWLTLSAVGGTLAAGSSTNITATITANANSLAAGNYSDTIGFTNTTNGAGNTTRAVSLSVGNTWFYDDFGTFAPGNLAGQQSWTQLGAVSTVPIQITGGQAGFAGGLAANSQTVYKNFKLTNETVFYGLTLTVTNAPNTNAISAYFITMYSSSNATGNASFRLAAESPNAAKTNFVLGVKVTPAANDLLSFGATGLTYGTQYRVIVEALVGGTNVIVYVNPTSGVLGAQIAYTNNTVASGVTTVGSVAIAQVGSGTVPSAGGTIGKFVVSDNFGTVYADLLGPPPPVASFTGSPTSGVVPLAVTFTDTSTGSITNWSWSFGDGGTASLSTNIVPYTYTTAGVYTVTEIVSGAGGSSTNTQVNYITVLTPFQAWQIQYFGSTTNPAAAANADPDGDGQNNLAEFLAGTDPTNGASGLRITSVTTQGSDVLVTWMTAGGYTNVVQVNTGLLDGSYSTNFQDLSGLIIISGSGDATTNYLDSGGATNAPARYYRIRLQP
jgi:PKD repeat protein